MLGRSANFWHEAQILLFKTNSFAKSWSSIPNKDKINYTPVTQPLSPYRWKFLIVDKSISFSQSSCKMPRKFLSIQHVAYEISPTLEQLRCTEISPPYHLKRNFAISLPKWSPPFLAQYSVLKVKFETWKLFATNTLLLLFTFKTGWYIAPSQCSKEYFPILFLSLRKLLEQGVLSWLDKVLFVPLPRFYRKSDRVARGQI